jgi:hypothetical protein
MLSASFGLISVFALHFLGGTVTQNLSSLDWAGYIINSDSVNPKPVVTSISGSWIVPEITASENAFMQGREQTTEKKKSQKQKTSHDDSVSVELAKDEYQKD